VQGHEARAQAGGGEHRLQERRLVQPQEPDAVAPTDPAGAQAGGQAVDAVEELGIGARGPLEAERPAVRGGGRPPGEPAAQADVDGRGHDNSSLGLRAPTIGQTPRSRWPGSGPRKHGYSALAWRRAPTRGTAARGTAARAT